MFLPYESISFYGAGQTGPAIRLFANSPSICRVYALLGNVKPLIFGKANKIDTMVKELISELNETYDALLQTLQPFTAEQLDTVPFEGSWTAGQTMEHVIKAGNGAGLFLRENTVPSDRPIDKNVATFRSILLNFDLKLTSPDFIVPTATVHNKEMQVKQLQAIRKDLTESAAELDLSLTCLGFEMPRIGHLTRLEWLEFNIVHTQRHTRQLKNIYQALQRAGSMA